MNLEKVQACAELARETVKSFPVHQGNIESADAVTSLALIGEQLAAIATILEQIAIEISV